MQATLTSPYSTITKLVRTDTEANELISAVEEISKSLFQTNMSFENALDNYLPKQFTEPIKGYMSTHNMNTTEKQTLRPFFDDLADYLRKLPKATLVLGFIPSENVIAVIASWLKKELNEEIIFSYNVDRSLLGGVVISYGGIYRDVSLKKMLEKIFIDKKEALLAVFV